MYDAASCACKAFWASEQERRWTGRQAEMGLDAQKRVTGWAQRGARRKQPGDVNTAACGKRRERENEEKKQDSGQKAEMWMYRYQVSSSLYLVDDFCILFFLFIFCPLWLLRIVMHQVFVCVCVCCACTCVFYGFRPRREASASQTAWGQTSISPIKTSSRWPCAESSLRLESIVNVLARP